MKRSMSLIAFAGLVALSTHALAVPITLTHAGSGGGTLAGSAFANTGFTITATADTDNWASCGGSTCNYLDHVSASIEINGLGTFDFVTLTRTFVNNNIVGFSRGGSLGSDLYNGPNDVAIGGWDRMSDIGPIAGTANLLQWLGEDVITSGGVLVFDGDSVLDASFSAAIGDPTTPPTIPEPGSLALVLTAVAGLIGRSLRRA